MSVEEEALAILKKRGVIAPTVDDVIAAFQKHLYLNDATVIEAVLGAVAANHLQGFDPVWLLVVGSSGGGKTEILRPLTTLPHVHLAATLTMAGLLSGSSKRDRGKDATGGLLRQVGDFGIIVPKDFTSVLTMSGDRRDELLSALREIYDGEWVRHVGTDGGQMLAWKGKVGMIGAVTKAIDSAHRVTSVMGERFLNVRLPADSGAHKARKALTRGQSPTRMRADLSEAVAALFDETSNRQPRQLAEDEVETLIERASFVATARSGVERDSYSREVELILDTETPTRLALQLAALLAGLDVIGVGRPRA